MSIFANGAAGAAAGSVVPGVGTAVGGVVGALSGILGGENKDPVRYSREQALYNRVLAGGADGNAAAKTLYENATGADGDNNPKVTRQYAQGFISQLASQGIQVSDNGITKTNAQVSTVGTAASSIAQAASAFTSNPGTFGNLLVFGAIGLVAIGVTIALVRK